MEEILNLIVNYSTQGKIVDENLMRKIIAIMIDIKNINEYVSKFELSSSTGYETAVYLSEDKTIRVYDSVIDLIRNKKIISLFKTEEIILFYNLLIVQILLHELEHANQWKIMDNEDTIEAFILKISYSVSEKQAFNIYEIMPNERLAEIKSFNEINKLIKPIENEKREIANFMFISWLEKKLRGYHYTDKSVTVPIVNFLVQTGNEELIENFDWFDINYLKSLKLSLSMYSLDERMNYGFPITDDEYRKMGTQIILSDKYKSNQNRFIH